MLLHLDTLAPPARQEPDDDLSLAACDGQSLARMLSDFERAQLASPGTPDAELVIQLAKDTLNELGLQPA